MVASLMDVHRRVPQALWQPKEFAILLGLEAGVTGTSPKFLTETERLSVLTTYVNNNGQGHEIQQNIIWARFCALYLPATVDRFLDPPVSKNESIDVVEDLQLNNASLLMLATVQHTAYFYKYLRSQSSNNGGGRKLAQTIAQRLVALGPKWNGYMLNASPSLQDAENLKSIVATTLQLLCTLLVIFMKEVNETNFLAPQTKAHLQRLLKPWAARYYNVPLGEFSLRALNLFNGNAKFQREVRCVIRRDLKGWEVCAKDGCTVTINLKACGKCQTVRYCSPEHQRAHWKFPVCPHKDMCFRTIY